MHIFGAELVDKILDKLEDGSKTIEQLRTDLKIDNNFLTSVLNDVDGVLIVKEKTGRTKGELIRKITSQDKRDSKKMENYTFIIHETHAMIQNWNERVIDHNQIWDAFANLDTLNDEQKKNLIEFTSSFLAMLGYDTHKFALLDYEKKYGKEKCSLLDRDIKIWKKDIDEIFDVMWKFVREDCIYSREILTKFHTKASVYSIDSMQIIYSNHRNLDYYDRFKKK